MSAGTLLKCNFLVIATMATERQNSYCLRTPDSFTLNNFLDNTMKLKIVASTTLLAAISVLSLAVQAGQSNSVKPAPKVTTEQTAQASEPIIAASAPVAKKHAAQDKSKHYHPRDGK